MNLADIISLAKAGYTPSDVREFLKAETPEKDLPSSGSEGGAPAEKTDPVEPEKTDPEKNQDPDSGDTPQNATGANAEAIDYKAKYEAAEKALKAAQAANTKQQQPEAKSDQEIFSAVAATFM